MAPAAQYFWVLLQERFCSISLRPVGKTEKLSARLCRSGWVAAVAFSVHAAVLGIAYLAASYRSGFVATANIVDDPKYGIISSGIAAVAALWAWRKRW